MRAIFAFVAASCCAYSSSAFGVHADVAGSDHLQPHEICAPAIRQHTEVKKARSGLATFITPIASGAGGMFRGVRCRCWRRQGRA